MEWTHEGVIITVTNEGYFTVQHGEVDKSTGELEVTKYAYSKNGKRRDR